MKWRPVALNFGLGLIANALVIALADLNRYGGQMASLYCLMCLPVSALMFCVGAWLGAEQAKRTESSRTAGAVVGIWVSAVVCSALSVMALLTVGPGD